ncbi:WD40 repeat domain-containing serine/threonine protein kinase [Streptacidiphilus carbonis]|uniref:WD40 repeat domain-containing serine/threonine protein kinase n=1 Tax=Streptacidiphilus carbonis TaxID=105422 RepID=UPI00069438AA|nr:WD40 repeat domain-containing serine/threonine protein kinase [Streptacidiphilus carbonis]
MGDFYLDGRLGAGGQGAVFEGYAPDGRRVAVKVLHEVDAESRGMLRRELRAWQLVEPFCTARLLYTDLAGPIPFVVSEYVAGPNLRQAIRAAGPHAPQELRRLAVGMAAALVAVHRAGVVHRDLKPENILLGPDGPRVIDFGIARVVEGTATTGLPMGTLRYMPPERYRGLPGDGKVDVWGWGALVLFAATGQDAFGGENLAEIAYRVATHRPDVSGLEEPLRSLVRSALSHDPAERPSAEQLLLTLVGRADLASAVREAGAGGPVKDVPADSVGPSRGEVAEAVFSRLNAAAQDAVPAVLLRLVAAGERAEDTLRSAHRGEFSDGRTPEHVLDWVLRAFTEAGILVWQGYTATLSSAALLRSWPRLHDWVEAERSGLSTHQRLTEGARTWTEHGRRRNDLVQGSTLDRMRDWSATGRRHLALNLAEQAFLEAAAELGRRRGRLRMLLSAVLAFLLVVAVGGAAVAFDQWRTTVAQRDQAASGQVAALALSLRVTDPQLARRLAVAAAQLGDTPQAWSALLAVRYQLEHDAFKLEAPTTAGADDLDGTGQTFAVAAGARVDFWNVRTRARTGSYTAPAKVRNVILSQDGTVAAVVGDDGVVRFVGVTAAKNGAMAQVAPALSAPKSSQGNWPALQLSPHGGFLVVETSDTRSTMTVRDIHTGRAVASLDAGGSSTPILDTSFSPDEGVLSLPVPSGGQPFTWIDLHTGRHLPVPVMNVQAKNVTGAVAFSPDGKSAAVATLSNTVSLFARTQDGASDTLTGADQFSPYPLTFSHNSRYLAQGATVWDAEATTPKLDPVLTHPTTRTDCSAGTFYRFTADDKALECVGIDGFIRSLDVSAFTAPPGWETDGNVDQAAVSPDRSAFALLHQNRLEIWSAQSRTSRLSVEALAKTDPPTSTPDKIQIGPGGQLAAVLRGTGIEIWEPAKKDGALLGTFPFIDPTRVSNAVTSLAFSPDGSSLAAFVTTTDGTDTLTFWNLRTMKQIHSVSAHLGNPGNPGSLLFAPDGRSVVSPEFGKVAFPSGQTLLAGSSDVQFDAISTDGTTLYSYPHASRPSLQTWNAATLRPQGDDLYTGTLNEPLFNPVWDNAVSPDGRLLATAQQQGTDFQFALWDTRDRTQLGVPLIGPTGDIEAVAFSPDGATLTAVDKYGRFYAYPLAPTALAHSLCTESGALTKAEWKAYIPDVPYRHDC